MKIRKVSRIKNYRVFRDFSWLACLPEFKDYNLVYGWNGSGKTILSNIFRDLEHNRNSVIGSSFQIETDNGTIHSSDLGNAANLPQVRVFNREFIADNVFTASGDVVPIFVLGEDSIEKQKEIDRLKGQLVETIRKALAKRNQVKDAEKDIDDFNIAKAREIKQLLSSSGENPYNNYDKASFKEKCQRLKLKDCQTVILDDETKNTLKKKKEATPKDRVELVKFSFADIVNLISSLNSILSKTVVSKVIERLENDSKVSDWVAEGLKKHREKASAFCLFCEQPLPNGYLEKLEGHFNDEYNRFISDIEDLNGNIEGLISTVNKLTLPNKAEFYEHLQIEYQTKRDSFEKEKQAYIEILTKLKQKSVEKKNSPFISVKFDEKPSQPNQSVIDALNKVIEQHNSETADFHNVIKDAREKLEKSCVAELLAEVIKKENWIGSLKSESQKLNEDVNQISSKISILEHDIVGHRRPADELNKDLDAYLGRDELKFEIKENGYQITRNGATADALSEGEKTAIAFLYFLKSLKDKNFDFPNGIVVIDDPVSSLDANSLFNAFGFMKERTKKVGQLFILTHNFCFFRQVKNWLTYINEHKKKLHKESDFYMLQCEGSGASRCAKIATLDRLLIDYESEYHYLFSLVYQGANLKNGELKQFYYLPNIGRRLLEAFLAFRKPSTETLYVKLEQLNFDNAKKARILRFLNTQSHSGDVDDPEHDISILSETPEVLRDILDLVKSEDKGHFEEMERAITNA